MDVSRDIWLPENWFPLQIMLVMSCASTNLQIILYLEVMKLIDHV